MNLLIYKGLLALDNMLKNIGMHFALKNIAIQLLKKFFGFKGEDENVKVLLWLRCWINIC